MDPFAVLGIAPTASGPEIRDAYLRRSKALHPDRFAAASAAEQGAATRAMQEVNAAYLALRSGTYVALPEPPPPPTSPPGGPGAPYAATRPAPETRRRRLSRPVVLLFGFVGIAGLILLAGRGGGPQHVTPASPNQTVDLNRLQGSCLAYNDAGRLDNIVDCTRPHAARVMKVVDHGTPCPIWTDGSIPGPTKDLCLDTHQ
jgi:DnaJ-like protein